MRYKFTLLLFSTFYFFSYCNEKGVSYYAIADFRTSLQPHLSEIVEKGMVTMISPSLKEMISERELIMLSKSEHPVLRVFALKELFSRDSINANNLLMDNLDDTSMVVVDEGEFGMAFRTVADELLHRSVWPDQQAKEKTIDKLISEHSYLQSAYEILSQIEAREKLYPFINAMVINPKLDEDGYIASIRDFEHALYGLAKFKKKEDISLIREMLRSNIGQLSHVSLRLMKEFPDSSYFNLLTKLYYSEFFQFTGKRRNGFTGYRPDRLEPEDIIHAVVAQQTQESARLLNSMLVDLKEATCLPDKEEIERQLVLAIWNCQAPVYASIRNRIRKRAEEYKAMFVKVEADPSQWHIDRDPAVYW